MPHLVTVVLQLSYTPSLLRLRPHAYLPWWEKTVNGEICHFRHVFRRTLAALGTES